MVRLCDCQKPKDERLVDSWRRIVICPIRYMDNPLVIQEDSGILQVFGVFCCKSCNRVLAPVDIDWKDAEDVFYAEFKHVLSAISYGFCPRVFQPVDVSWEEAAIPYTAEITTSPPEPRRWFVTEELTQWRFMSACGNYAGPFATYPHHPSGIDPWELNRWVRNWTAEWGMGDMEGPFGFPAKA